MAIVPITNLRGPAARIASFTAQSVPADQAAAARMTGPDQNREIEVDVPRGLPGVNAIENDAAVATYVMAPDSDTALAIKNTAGRGISVATYGAVGDGVTDDAPAIQDALDAGGNGSTVFLVPGKKYRLLSGLTMYTWQRLEGSSAQFGTGTSAPAELIFQVSGSTIGIRARSYTYLKDLLIRGPGDAVGTCVGVKMIDASGNSIHMENVSINDWATGAHLDQVYYGRLTNLEFRRNAVGLKITSSLNISLFKPQINGQRADNTVGVGIDGTARALTIFGGSIEQFQSGIKMFHSETLNLFGVYFESTVAGVNVRGIDAPAFINTTINAYGCYIYMPNLTSWMELRGGTGRALNAHGNAFISPSGVWNVAGAAAYRFTVGHIVDISGDNWTRMDAPLAVYAGADGGGFPAPGARIEYPAGYTAGGGVPGVVLDGRLPLRPVEAKTVTVAGPATINPVYGNTQITLQANATSMSFDTPGNNRQQLVLTVIQDATGGRTYVYPTNFRFAGGTAPNNTTANTRTTVTMRFDGTRWFEESRAVGIPNT